MRVSTACLMVLVAGLACASAVDVGDWQLSGKAAPGQLHHISIGLALPEGTMAALEATCQSVSDPDSVKYTQYLSREEVTKMVASEDNLEIVSAFFRSAGALVTPSVTRDALRVSIRVADAERLLGVSLSVYNHAEVSKMKIVRSEQKAQLPSVVEAAIDIMTGVQDFPKPSKHIMKRIRSEIKQRAAEQTASTAASTATMQVPTEPVVGLMYVSDNQATLMVIQACGTNASATAMPCAGTPFAVEYYMASVYVDGEKIATPIKVPLSAVSAEIMPTPTVNQTVYNVAIPVPLKPGQKINVTLSAVNSAGASSYGSLPWHIQNGMTHELERMMATPYVTPEYLINFYGLGDMPTPLPAGLSQAVAEFGQQFYSPVDLANFFDRFKLPVAPVKLVGLNDGPQAGGEASLDIEYIAAVGQGVETYFWSVTPGSAPTADSFLFEWASQVNAASNPPLVTSISYGIGENQLVESGLGNDYVSRTNAEFLKLCARGVSVVTAAGDAGASNDGHGSNSCALQPDFPSSSPWITTVSASFVDPTAPARAGVDVGESIITIPNGMFWSTGGGFSSEASCHRPWYQNDLVSKYLASGVDFPPSSTFNSTLRAYPDVSAIGHNLMVQLAGTLVSIDGTSASSPIFAGVITRLNAFRMTAGKAPVGFVNPLLYKLAASNPTVFHDLTVGDNRCAGFTCCPTGYQATTGFDAVSGLGSVGDFDLLKNLVVAA